MQHTEHLWTLYLAFWVHPSGLSWASLAFRSKRLTSSEVLFLGAPTTLKYMELLHHSSKRQGRQGTSFLRAGALPASIQPLPLLTPWSWALNIWIVAREMKNKKHWVTVLEGFGLGPMDWNGWKSWKASLQAYENMGARIRNAIPSDLHCDFPAFPHRKKMEGCERQKALCLSQPGHEKPLRAARKKIEFAWAAEPNRPGIVISGHCLPVSALIAQSARLLPSFDVVAVSQVPSPESNPT